MKRKFSGSHLGKCNNKELNFFEPIQIEVTMPSSDDKWRGSSIKIQTLNDKSFNCPINEWVGPSNRSIKTDCLLGILIEK